MTDLVEALRIKREAELRTERSIMPGKLGNVTRQGEREIDADFDAGVADLVAGEADPGTPSADAPRLTLAGGGYYVCLPAVLGDEGLGLVSDRTLDTWRETRTPGEAPVLERFKDDSDLLIAPLMIAAPPGAPLTWDHLIIGGPAGPAIEIGTDNSVVLTKGGDPVATIEINAAGEINLTPAAGQSANIGGVGAVELAKAQIIQAIQTAMQDAVTAAAPIVPPAGDGGTAGFTAMLASFGAAAAGNVLQTLIAKGV